MTSRMGRRLAGGAAVLAVMALPAAASAAHGKAGLWKITVTTSMGGLSMADIPPAARARMKEMGIDLSRPRTITTQHCMTAAEVNADTIRPAQPPHADCKMANQTASGHTFTADMICKGEMTGKGHMTVTFDSPEHYSGKMMFTGRREGHVTQVSDTFDGRWLSADCGNVHH